MTDQGRKEFPPDKGGKGGFVPYNKALTDKARQNRRNPNPGGTKILVRGSET